MPSDEVKILSPVRVRNKLKSLRLKRQKILDEIVELQEKCRHPNLFLEYKGDTYYEPNHKGWKEFKCPDCEKFWTEPQ